MGSWAWHDPTEVSCAQAKGNSVSSCWRETGSSYGAGIQRRWAWASLETQYQLELGCPCQGQSGLMVSRGPRKEAGDSEWPEFKLTLTVELGL